MTNTRKPYTVESFKAGKKAETRGEKPVSCIRILDTRLSPMCGLIDLNGMLHWKLNGKYNDDESPSDLDLFEKED
jgi:hypothetical protein